MCIRHGGRWQGAFRPATAPGTTCWIRDILFLCLSVIFFVRFIGTFLVSAVFMKKLYADISYYIWKRFLSTKIPKLLINTVNQFMNIVIFAARLCQCLRLLTQVKHIKFLMAFSQVEIFNCGRVTRSPCLDGKDQEHCKLSIPFRNSENLLFGPDFC